MRPLVLVLALATVLAVPAAADAAQLIDRDVTSASLAVNAKGWAMLTYRDAGKVKHVLAWGAVNAIAPTKAHKQVAFRLDYSGGWGTLHEKQLWKHFGNTCTRYDGPPLPWLVTACKAPDGSYWALQAWRRLLPNYGGTTAPQELYLSHWTGPLPVLTIHLDWSYRKYDHLFGTFTYRGHGVYGFAASKGGNPLDTFGRNVYVDTFDSAYGTGWHRENSFLTHTGTGAFCYGFYRHGKHPIGKGSRYRATAIGPGVTPLVMWRGAGLGPYDADVEAQARKAIAALGDPACKPV